jgi:hypothetical protein
MAPRKQSTVDNGIRTDNLKVSPSLECDNPLSNMEPLLRNNENGGSSSGTKKRNIPDVNKASNGLTGKRVHQDSLDTRSSVRNNQQGTEASNTSSKKPAASNDPGIPEGNTDASILQNDKNKKPSNTSAKKPGSTNVPGIAKGNTGTSILQNDEKKKSSTEESSVYASTYKRMLSQSPAKHKTSKPTDSKKTYSPVHGRRPCKINTVGTHDGTVIAWASFLSYNGCAYTTPIYTQLQADPKLCKMTKVTHLANRRGENPFRYWEQPTLGQQGSFKKKWHVYCRKLSNPEDNTPQLRVEWGKSLATLFTSFGKRFEFPVTFEYAGDLRMTHLSDYMTVEDVFLQIENVFLPPSYAQDEVQKKRQWIHDNTDLLQVYFGNVEFLDSVKAYYRDTRRLIDRQELVDNADSDTKDDKKHPDGGVDGNDEDDIYALARRIF